MSAVRRTRTAMAARVVALGTVLALAICAQAQSQTGEWAYTARPGDNLWNLSLQYLARGAADVERLRVHNGIDRPERIAPGTRIRIPIDWLKLQPAPARVLQVVGSASRVAARGEPATALTEGDLLEAGDSLTTAASSSVLIEFADGSRVLVKAETTLVMDTLSAYAGTGMVDTRMRLPGGRTEHRVEPAKGPGSRYEIVTPPAVAAVRGTDFRVGVDAAGQVARSEVTEGLVGVAGQGASREVGGGFGLRAEVGQPLAEPRALLPAPDLGALPARVNRLQVELQWPPLAGAEQYRIQLFAGEGFQRLEFEAQQTRPSVTLALPGEGQYRLRVRGIDDLGLEGLDADHPLELMLPPPAPALLQPPDGAELPPAQPPAFSWAADPAASLYDFQLAADRDFATLVVRGSDLPRPELRLAQALPPGVYYWRVAAGDSRAGLGTHGEARVLTVLAVPEVPELGASEIDADGLRLSWSRGEHAERFEVQLARDRSFTDLVSEQTVTDPSLQLQRPEPGTYYLRLRAVSTRGVRGPYGETIGLEVPEEPFPWGLFFLLLLPQLLL